MSHHVEAFFDDDDVWGWQCFEPDCDAVESGFDNLAAAEADADRHMEEA